METLQNVYETTRPHTLAQTEIYTTKKNDTANGRTIRTPSERPSVERPSEKINRIAGRHHYRQKENEKLSGKFPRLLFWVVASFVTSCFVAM